MSDGSDRQRTGFRIQGNAGTVLARPSQRVDLQRALNAGNTSADVLQCPTLRHKLAPRPSPFIQNNYFGGGFVSDDDRVFLDSIVHAAGEAKYSRRDSHENMEALARLEAGRGESDGEDDLAGLPKFALRSGPRETIYFNPAITQIAIVVVGGLCPGVNDLIRSIVSKASDYGVPEGNIRGIPFGFKGFQDPKLQNHIRLTRRNTDAIHMEGGSMLGTSSVEGNVGTIVKWLDLWSIDMLFVIGGIQGMRVASDVVKECERVNVPTAVIAIPKSIDNDILLVDRAFGFETAVEEAQKALMAAKVEASSAYKGIGLVKLMGRQSGFIAIRSSLASGLVDVCLIPEVSFQLAGKHGLFAYLEKVLQDRGHAIVCISEGAGQDLVPDEPGSSSDSSSGDEVPVKNVGPWLLSQLKKNMKDVDVKYINAGTMIRSVPATSNDRVYCKTLAHAAVHAAFAGYTGTMVGLVNTHNVYLPLVAGLAARKVDPQGALWSRLRASTGQPEFC